MEYRKTIKRHLNAISGSIMFVIYLLIAFFYFGEVYGFEKHLIWFFSILFIVNIAVVLYLHFQYNKEDEGKILSIDRENSLMTIDNGREKILIPFVEIQKIEIHMMPSKYRGSNIQFFPFEEYNYAVIFVGHEKYIITCLMIENLRQFFLDLGLNVIRIKELLTIINK
ncbi:MAG: hypothetical protein Q8909_08445 [Bacteroidota bacterium]|nr:hypothetical protein [Bacteroidota bacterium]